MYNCSSFCPFILIGEYLKFFFPFYKVWNFTISACWDRSEFYQVSMRTLNPFVVWIRVPVVGLLGLACSPWSKAVPCVEHSYNRVVGRNNTAEKSNHGLLSAGGIGKSCASYWSELHTFKFRSNWILPQSLPEEINHSWVLTLSTQFSYLPVTSRVLIQHLFQGSFCSL